VGEGKEKGGKGREEKKGREAEGTSKEGREKRGREGRCRIFHPLEKPRHWPSWHDPYFLLLLFPLFDDPSP